MAQLYRPAQGPDPFERTPPQPLPITVDGAEEWEVERIVNSRFTRRKNRRVRQYLVRWKGFTAKDDSWLDRTELIPNARDLLEAYDKARN